MPYTMTENGQFLPDHVQRQRNAQRAEAEAIAEATRREAAAIAAAERAQADAEAAEVAIRDAVQVAMHDEKNAAKLEASTKLIPLLTKAEADLVAAIADPNVDLNELYRDWCEVWRLSAVLRASTDSKFPVPPEPFAVVQESAAHARSLDEATAAASALWKRIERVTLTTDAKIRKAAK